MSVVLIYFQESQNGDSQPSQPGSPQTKLEKKRNDKDVELEIADIHWIIGKAREFQKKKKSLLLLH